MRLPETMGEVAYQAYCCELSKALVGKGESLPEFPDNPEHIQKAWEAAVDAVLGRVNYSS